MYPSFKPPADFAPVNTKKTRKIYIPVEKHPEYNFIGLIIGPRGNTQKRMEKETGCKIVIRGKGSIKEGKHRKDGVKDPGEDDILHVLITADSEDQLDRATKMINELLVPVEEGKNEHKRQQLRELAEINGTLRDKNWMTPLNFEPSFEPANVKCAICGEVSHPTSDCSLRGNAPLPGQAALVSEYDKFLSEIGEAPMPTQAPKSSETDAYAELMASISEGNGQPAPGSTVPPWLQGQAYGAPNPWGATPGAPWANQAPNPWGMQPTVPFGAPGAVPLAPGAVPLVPGSVPPPWQAPPQ